MTILQYNTQSSQRSSTRHCGLFYCNDSESEAILWGGRGATGVKKSFPSIPIGVRLGNASKEEKREARNIVHSFMTSAKPGERYRMGASIGDTSRPEIKIVSYNRSPNKMGIKSVSSGRTVALSTTNARSYLGTGLTLVGREKSVY